MKTATLPPIRVEPEFREAAEAVLKDGETLSSFIEETIRRQVNYRKVQAEFLARGLKALERIEAGAQTHKAEDVHAELEDVINRAALRHAGE